MDPRCCDREWTERSHWADLSQCPSEGRAGLLCAFALQQPGRRQRALPALSPPSGQRRKGGSSPGPWAAGPGRPLSPAPPTGTALQCYSCKAQTSNEDCLHVENCSLSETHCWTERISEWPRWPQSCPWPRPEPLGRARSRRTPAPPRRANPLDSLHLPAVGRDSKNPGLGLHHGTELRVLAHPSLCPPMHLSTPECLLSFPPVRPHPLLSRPAIPPPILQALIVHAFIHLSPHPPLAPPPSHPFATPPPPTTHPLRTHSAVRRPSLTRPFPHSLVPDTFLEPSRSGCLGHVDTAGPLPSHCL